MLNKIIKAIFNKEDKMESDIAFDYLNNTGNSAEDPAGTRKARRET